MPPTSAPSPTPAISQPYTASPPWSSAYETAATVIEPSAIPTKRNAPSSASSPGERSAPSQCASRGAERHAREGGETTTEQSPEHPDDAERQQRGRADHSDTHSVTSSGPTVNMTSCATASIAYAVCTWSSLRSTEGHSARSPPSRGGVNSPATAIAAYASASGSVPARARRRPCRGPTTTAAGSCTRGCPWQVDEPAQQRLPHRVGDAVHGRQRAREAVACRPPRGRTARSRSPPWRSAAGPPACRRAAGPRAAP